MSQAIYTSFVHEEAWKAGYATESDTKVVEAKALPDYTTKQQDELIAFTHVFQLAQGQYLNIYTDFKYAFDILLSHTAISKEHRLITTKGGSITN